MLKMLFVVFFLYLNINNLLWCLMVIMKNNFEMLSWLILFDYSFYLFLFLGNINYKVYWEDMKWEEGI